ncbi:MAG: carboxypeptidase-like regulatory domain-containing protein, partial [Flavobacteriales bacterium]|nr:carboxypeptidase-like regulatory domain-containing protein [Flavobacteriales bacterium]
MNSVFATTIKGIVKDEQGLPLYHVAVFVPGTNLGTHTNENGEYQINLKSGKYELTFNFIGYEKFVKSLQSENSLETPQYS